MFIRYKVKFKYIFLKYLVLSEGVLEQPLFAIISSFYLQILKIKMTEFKTVSALSCFGFCLPATEPQRISFLLSIPYYKSFSTRITIGLMARY